MSSAEELLDELVRSGLMTRAEAEGFIARRGAREFAELAVKAIVDMSPWPVREVTVKTEAWNVSWINGQMTVTPVKPRSKPIQAESRAASGQQVEGIPAAVWQEAANALGLKYFGPRAAARSQRIRSKAIEIAKQRGIIA